LPRAVFADVGDTVADHIIGFHEDMLISDVSTYSSVRHLLGPEPRYMWRSGIKHDCSKVMELAVCPGGHRNALEEVVSLEDDYVFPMLKSSDVHNGKKAGARAMLVPQRTVGGDTAGIKAVAPSTWRYLEQHAAVLAARGSSIYRDRPPFSVFGVGNYSFAPWKVAISGFYKSLRFTCGFRRSRPGIPSVIRAPFQSDAAHHSNLMALRVVSSRRPVSSCHDGGAWVKQP